MHGLIKDHLEDLLTGVPNKHAPDAVERHLGQCEACSNEVKAMREQTPLFAALRAPEQMDPAPGFYARVMERVEGQRSSSIWAAFLDPIFARRLVATSVAVAALMGGYLAFTESGGTPVPNAAAVMAVEDHPPGLGQDRQRDRDTILVTLATYHE